MVCSSAIHGAFIFMAHINIFSATFASSLRYLPEGQASAVKSKFDKNILKTSYWFQHFQLNPYVFSRESISYLK